MEMRSHAKWRGVNSEPERCEIAQQQAQRRGTVPRTTVLFFTLTCDKADVQGLLLLCVACVRAADVWSAA